MKTKSLVLLAFGLLLSVYSHYAQAQNLIVGTYNLRYANPSDTGNMWAKRAPIVASLIRFHEFDVLGTQEGLLNQLQDIQAALPQYERSGKKTPVILTGDFNGSHESSWYQRVAHSDILSDTYSHVEHPYANNASFNGFKNTVPGNEIIDHIFTSPDFTVERWGILTDSYHGKYPSDHFPVLSEIRLN